MDSEFKCSVFEPLLYCYADGLPDVRWWKLSELGFVLSNVNSNQSSDSYPEIKQPRIDAISISKRFG